MDTSSKLTPEISIVIPAYNEEQSLHPLMEELYPVMKNMGRSFEIIFTNDGSRDKTLDILKEFCATYKEVKVIDFGGNYGQHMAIMAAFEQARGSKIITLDADLQNPPKEIPRLVEEMDKGHDVVGTYRVGRNDPVFRKVASKCVNKATNKIAGLRIQDYGCMLRGYDRRIIDIINASQENSTFIPALAQKFATNPIEIPIAHRSREFGESKYSLFQLIRLNFDLMTSFSTVPLQLVTVTGMLISVIAFLVLIFLTFARFALGIHLTTRSFFSLAFDALEFILIGANLLAVGVIGEYVGRIYKASNHRPRYSIRKIYSNGEDNE